MATQAFLTKNIGHVVELCDDLVAEQNKVTRYHRQVMIQQSQIEAFRIKRRQENAERKARGEDPLPEEDMTLFKPIDPPTLLDNYLISSQMVTYADQVNSFAKQSLAKLHVASGL